MAPQCSICLSHFKDPVCLPCGHLYCKNCLTEHVNVPSNRGMTSTCPDCRTTFNLAVPDLTYLPQKYHPFISHAIRRVYIDLSPTPTPDPSLQKQLTTLQARLSHKSKHEELLLNKCESLSAAVHAHRAGEHEAHKRVAELEGLLHEMGTEYAEYMHCARTTEARMEAENMVMRKDNYEFGKRIQELEASLAASEARRHALERNAYVRHSSDSDESDGLSSLSSPEPACPYNPPRKSNHKQSKEWSRSHEQESSRTHHAHSPVSASASRAIKPLPRRLRVTRGRDDDSVVVGSTKRARMRG